MYCFYISDGIDRQKFCLGKASTPKPSIHGGRYGVLLLMMLMMMMMLLLVLLVLLMLVVVGGGGVGVVVVGIGDGVLVVGVMVVLSSSFVVVAVFVC